MLEQPIDTEIERIVAELRVLKHAGDIEMAHYDADKLIVGFLRRIGYGEMADAWDGVPKWYA